MYAIEQIKEYLKPEGRIVISNLKKEINLIAEQINENDVIENAGTAIRGMLTRYLIVLTSNRLLTTDKQKRFVSYDIDKINKINFTKKLTATEMIFDYENVEQKISFQHNDISLAFMTEVKNSLGYSSDLELSKERKVVHVMKPIKMGIEILNGKEQLKTQGRSFSLTQTKPGVVNITIDTHSQESFKLIKWDRVDNVQKSVLDIVGWTAIGSAFGNAGAIAGAMGANVGKDKSVATLFLKRENGDKVPLVIKCDKKDLEKLSLLIVSEGEEEATQTSVTPSPTTAIPTDDLIKLKELMDAGILTQEEFDTKKKQLLGI
jgi:hypothetical protein